MIWRSICTKIPQLRGGGVSRVILCLFHYFLQSTQRQHQNNHTRRWGRGGGGEGRAKVGNWDANELRTCMSFEIICSQSLQLLSDKVNNLFVLENNKFKWHFWMGTIDLLVRSQFLCLVFSIRYIWVNLQ